MKKLAIILVLITITINLFGQNKSIFSEYPFRFIEDSLLYYHYDTKGSNPFHLKFNKEQTSEILSLFDTLNISTLGNNQITHTINSVQVYKLNSPTNKSNIVTFIISSSILEIYINNEWNKRIKLEPITPKLTKITKEIIPVFEELEPVSSSISCYGYGNGYIHQVHFYDDKSVGLDIIGGSGVKLNENDIIPFINYLRKYRDINQKLVAENVVVDFIRDIDSVTLNGIHYQGTFTYSSNNYTNITRNKYSFITLTTTKRRESITSSIKDFYYKIDGDKVRPTTIREYSKHTIVTANDFPIMINEINGIIEILTVKRNAYYDYIEKREKRYEVENEIVDKYFN